MEAKSAVAALALPAALWVAYLYYRDRAIPEPPLHVAVSFLLGIGSGALALFAYDLLDSLGWTFEIPSEGFGDSRFLAACFLVIGPLEELAKFLPFWLYCTRLRDFDEEIDGIVYASCIALGFATFENIHVLPELAGWEQWGRAISSPLVHSVFSSLFGFTWARAITRGAPPLRAGLAGLALAALAHGAYDYLVMTPLLATASAVAVGALWLWRIRVLHRLHREAEAAGPSRGGRSIP